MPHAGRGPARPGPGAAQGVPGPSQGRPGQWRAPGHSAADLLLGLARARRTGRLGLRYNMSEDHLTVISLSKDPGA